MFLLLRYLVPLWNSLGLVLCNPKLTLALMNLYLWAVQVKTECYACSIEIEFIAE